MKKSTLLLLFFPCLLEAQEFHLLNTNQSLVNLNPAFAGSNGLIRNQFSYRNLRPNLAGNTIIYGNAFDCYLKPLKAGLAVSAMTAHYDHGTFKTTAFSIAYAQHLSFSEDQVKVIPSLQFTYGQIALDFRNLHFEDQSVFVWNNPTMIPNPRISYADISSGILINYKKDLYLGAALFHINRPNTSLMEPARLPHRLLLHASYTMHLTDRTLVQVFYRFNQLGNRRFNQFAVNAIISKHLILGAGYTLNNQPHLNLGYRCDQFSVVLGYGAVLAAFPDTYASSAELHLSYNLRKKEIRKDTPNFENM